MAEIVEVLDAGQGWTKVRDSEGNVFKLEGSRNWRNNNPGNIEYGDFARSLGAVGTDGRFAVFPSYDAGRQAKEQLIFSSPSYKNLTLEQAISRYAPPNENNTRSYINQIVRSSGVPASTPMSQIPTSVRGNILDTMERVEGFQVGRTYNDKGIRLPPAEVPNVVASLTDTRRPTIAPFPATISPDLSLLRNPEMSVSARNAQVTPSPNVPLPRARPSAPDIVTPSMARVGMAAQPNVRQASDIGLLNTNPVTPRLTDAGDNIYSYHIPDMTPTAVVGGIGSLTPSRNGPVPAQQSSQLASIRARDQDLQAALNARYPTRLPDISPSAPVSSSLEQAARRAALTANQSYIDRTTPSIPVGSAVANVASQRAEQLGQRQATSIPMRLQPGTAAQNYDVSVNGPAVLTRQQYASLPVNPTRVATSSRVAPVPLSASARPIGMAAAPRTAAPSPLRIVVQREQQPVGMASPIQRLQQQGLTSAQAYDVLNAAARGSPSLEDRVSGRSGLSSSGASAYSLV